MEPEISGGVDDGHEARQVISRLGVRLAASAPFMMLPPVLMLAGLIAAGGRIHVAGVLLGSLGWLTALILRGPAAALTAAFVAGRQRRQIIGIALSGPLEEGIRLCVLIALGRSISMAFSIGAGWSEAEILFALVGGAAALRAHSKSKERAREFLRISQGRSPAWGILERTSATFAHTGFTLIAAAAFPAVFVTAIFHTGTNFAAVWLAPRSMAWTQAAIFCAGLTAFCVGLLVLGLTKR